jgi:toxin FitB
MLVDTNVISELKRGRHTHPRVMAWFSKIPNERVFTSVIVLGEIRRGIELVARSNKPQADVLERWYASIRQRLADRVLAVDEPIMLIWSKISVPDLLPAYDGLIAATALAHRMTVVTRNASDYQGTRVDIIDPWAA